MKVKVIIGSSEVQVVWRRPDYIYDANKYWRLAGGACGAISINVGGYSHKTCKRPYMSVLSVVKP